MGLVMPGPVTGSKEAIAERREKAFGLRVSGYSYRKIAAELGIDEGTSFRDVRAVLARITRRTNETAEEYIELELTRLDAVLQSMAQKMGTGDSGAAAVYLKACESRRKLLGLDAPERIDMTVTPQKAIVGVDLEQV